LPPILLHPKLICFVVFY
jgi:hypothetical protein